MKILEKEEVVKRVYGYESEDGKVFSSEEECRKYEESARFAASSAAEKLVVNSESGYRYHDDLFCIGYEDEVVVYQINTANDLHILNTKLRTLYCCSSDKLLGPEYIGEKVCVCYWDGDAFSVIGTIKSMREVFEKYLVSLFKENEPNVES